jgi:uncharacterized protein YndB with AHSA1/START domain
MGELDRIERQFTLDVSREEMWAAITEPELLGQWFGSRAELDLRPGGEGLFIWDELDVTTHVTVETVEPPEKFSYRWRSSKDGPTTLVEFSLEEVPGGTRLTLVESGFASAPEARQRNELGWDEELGELRDLLVRSRA